MSGGGATGPAFDAAGNALNIHPARGGIALYDWTLMKTPEIPPLEMLGEMLQYKNWLRKLNLLYRAAEMHDVLKDDAYDPASAKHKEAFSYIDPSNRPAYFVALRKAVRAKMYAALLKVNNALLQSILDLELSLPNMMKKLSATFGDTTDHSGVDLLQEIMQTRDVLPKSFVGLIEYLQQFVKLLNRYNNAGGNLSDLEALNMLIINLSKCPLDQLSVVLTIEKTEKIKDPDHYSLAKFINNLTSWASSEVEKPDHKYQSQNKSIFNLGKGSKGGNGRGNGKGKGRGRNNYDNNYNPTYNQNAYKGKSRGRGKGSTGRGRGKKGKGKGKGKGTDHGHYGQELVVYMDGKEYMSGRRCYGCNTNGHYERDCDIAWKQHQEREKRHHHQINMNQEHDIDALFDNGDDNYFGGENKEKRQRLSSMLLLKIAAGSKFNKFCQDAKDNGEFPALIDGGAESSVTNNPDLITNLKPSTVILEGFNGATAQAQGQGNLTFSTRCHKVYNDKSGKIVPNGEIVFTVDACLITESKLTIISENDMRKLGFMRADSTLGRISYICAMTGNIIIPYEFNGTLWITIKRPTESQIVHAMQSRTREERGIPENNHFKVKCNLTSADAQDKEFNRIAPRQRFNPYENIDQVKETRSSGTVKQVRFTNKITARPLQIMPAWLRGQKPVN